MKSLAPHLSLPPTKALMCRSTGMSFGGTMGTWTQPDRLWALGWTTWLSPSNIPSVNMSTARIIVSEERTEGGWQVGNVSLLCSVNQSHFKFLLYGGSKECIKTLQIDRMLYSQRHGYLCFLKCPKMKIEQEADLSATSLLSCGLSSHSGFEKQELSSIKLQVGDRLNQTSTDLSLSC